MEISDLNMRERNIIENLRENKKLSDFLKILTENYFHVNEGEEKIEVFLEMMFQNLDEFSEANLKAANQ